MKRNILISILLLLGAGASLTSCKDTWLTYDTSQRGKLYFPIKNMQQLDNYISTDLSFALLDQSVGELRAKVPVALMGMVADHDRTFVVRAIHDTTSYFTSGGVERELVDAAAGEDYTLGELVIPAGAVEAAIEVTVKRTPKLLEKTASDRKSVV